MVMITQCMKTQENLLSSTESKHKMCKSVQVAAADLNGDNEKMVR